MIPFQNILLATDFSRCSERATQAAVELATIFKARLTVVHVRELPGYPYTEFPVTPPALDAPIDGEAVAALEQTLQRARECGTNVKSISRIGVPATEILLVAAQLPADLIIIGTHGRRRMSRLLLGSVAERVVREANVPVLTLRGAAPLPEIQVGASASESRL